MTRVIVTGGSGKLGRATVGDLREHGYDVIVADTATFSGDPSIPFVKVDFENFDETTEAFAGMDWGHTRKVDAVVHLAAVPGPNRGPSRDIFRINTMSTYNVFEACRRLGIRNVVWASSETLLGIPYAEDPPYLPVDEDYPARPATAYSLSKLVGEQLAEQFCRWDSGTKIIGLRFSNVMNPEDYKAFPTFENNPAGRRWNLWTYIDARDGAQAVRKALELKSTGADVFVIANADGVMTRPNADLVAEFFPNVPFKRPVGENESLLSIEKARRFLGYEPLHSWRNQLTT